MKKYAYSTHRLPVLLVYIMLLCFTVNTFAQSECNFIAGTDITLINTNNLVAVDVTTEYVLAASTGDILYQSGTPVFTGVIAGIYTAYAVNYYNASAPDLSVASNINNIGTDCIDTTSVIINVCPCGQGSGFGDTEIAFTLVGQSVNPDYTQLFVLTDGLGNILGTYNSSPIPGLSNAEQAYNVYSVAYDNAEPEPVIVPGAKIEDLSLNGCIDLSRPLGFSLCPFLPLDLISFKGIEQDCEILLTWETANEIDISHFNIQESANGINFTTIGRIDANGGPNYSFSDNQLFITNYYRLEITGTDGSVEYSDIIIIDSECAGDISVIDIYPNPVKTGGLIYINFNSNGIDHESGKIIITDVLSRRVLEVPITVMLGNNEVSIDPSRLPAAPYLLHLEGDDWRSSVYKFIKTNE